MDYNNLTIEDCIREQEREGRAAVIEDGAVAGFEEEKCPYQNGRSDKGK